MSPRLSGGLAATNTRSDYRPSTASCDPRIGDAGMGDHIRMLSSDSGPRSDCGICPLTEDSNRDGAVMLAPPENDRQCRPPSACLRKPLHAIADMSSTRVAP